MARCVAQDVRAIIESDPTISMAPFIAAASGIVDYVASQDLLHGSVLTTTQLRTIESWVAAWAYERRDQGYQNKSTNRASATFQGQTDKYLSSNYWGQTAIVLDISGTLQRLNAEMQAGGKRKVGGFWAGQACGPVVPWGYP